MNRTLLIHRLEAEVSGTDIEEVVQKATALGAQFFDCSPEDVAMEAFTAHPSEVVEAGEQIAVTLFSATVVLRYEKGGRS